MFAGSHFLLFCYVLNGRSLRSQAPHVVSSMKFADDPKSNASLVRAGTWALFFHGPLQEL